MRFIRHIVAHCLIFVDILNKFLSVPNVPNCVLFVFRGVVGEFK